MKYLLMICEDPDLDAASRQRVSDAMPAYVDEMNARGVRLGMGWPLEPASAATTVRVRGGEVLTSAGPFAETREHIVGFDVIECDTLEEAIDVAARQPGTAYGSIEIRPIWHGVQGPV